jgi:hypothetical protein
MYVLVRQPTSRHLLGNIVLALYKLLFVLYGVCLEYLYFLLLSFLILLWNVPKDKIINSFSWSNRNERLTIIPIK